MARDCPDRQRGANWRNDAPGGAPGRPAGRIGGGDAVDREYEVRQVSQFARFDAYKSCSNLCKSFLVAVAALLAMEKRHNALKQVRVVMRMVGPTDMEKATAI